MKTILLLILVIILFLIGMSVGYSMNKQQITMDSQFIIIDGYALNPDHIVSFWKQNGTLHLMTDTKSTFRNGNRDNYYRFKFAEEEMKAVFDMLKELKK